MQWNLVWRTFVRGLGMLYKEEINGNADAMDFSVFLANILSCLIVKL